MSVQNREVYDSTLVLTTTITVVDRYLLSSYLVPVVGAIIFPFLHFPVANVCPSMPYRTVVSHQFTAHSVRVLRTKIGKLGSGLFRVPPSPTLLLCAAVSRLRTLMLLFCASSCGVRSCDLLCAVAGPSSVYVCCHPIYSGRQTCGRTSRGHTGGRSHRIFPPSFCGACLSFYLEKVSDVPFPRRR